MEEIIKEEKTLEQVEKERIEALTKLELEGSEQFVKEYRELCVKHKREWYIPPIQPQVIKLDIIDTPPNAIPQ